MMKLSDFLRNSIHILSLFALFVTVISCSDDDMLETKGNATATLNGVTTDFEVIWSDTSSERDSTFRLTLRHVIDNFNEGGLVITNIRNMTSNQVVFPKDNTSSTNENTQGRYSTSFQMDILNDIYDINQEEPNFIRINNYNASNRELSGSFQLYFNITEDGNASGPALPNLEFLNGSFTTKVEPGFFE